MPLSKEQRQTILDMLAAGRDRRSIASLVGVTVGQVSAVAAHVTMGTYAKITSLPSVPQESQQATETAVASSQINEDATARRKFTPFSSESVIWLGRNDQGEDIFWNPFPESGSANPHVLVFGESGFGKTYALQCLIAELSMRRLPTFVFDYGQGFSRETTPSEFNEMAQPVEIDAAKDGVAINPLTIFASDLHGPLNVAQRVADTFSRIYPKIGVQQHAILRDSVLDVFHQRGIVESDPSTWKRRVPGFNSLRDKLAEYAADPEFSNRSLAAKTASHISTIFVFNTFRISGRSLNWSEMLAMGNRCFVIRLKGLESSVEALVTEFLLWSLNGFLESLGPGSLRCFAILDEAHRLSLDANSPTERLLREGRKFGIGLILASQQPQDFSTVAFSNTATKLIFQTIDPGGRISRLITLKTNITGDVSNVAALISSLPRGTALVISENRHALVKIASFRERIDRWREAIHRRSTNNKS